MKLHPHPETDGLDVDGTDAPVGLDIDRASKKLDLTTLETQALPLRRIVAA